MVLQQKPPAVVQAMYTGNIALLSVLGKKGAEKRRQIKKTEQLTRSRMLAEMEERAHQANEDICPVDD